MVFLLSDPAADKETGDRCPHILYHRKRLICLLTQKIVEHAGRQGSLLLAPVLQPGFLDDNIGHSIPRVMDADEEEQKR
jgi:hypothetical protein